MTTGAWAANRFSIEPSMKVCVPPPDSPVQARRLGSASGNDSRKSKARILFQVCRPIKLMFQSKSAWLVATWWWRSEKDCPGGASAKWVSL